MGFELPSYVLQAIGRLERDGYAAYAVGGCVRDLLMGKTPHDYDLCTAALPEEIHACFAGETMLDIGLKHGTVTVLAQDGEPLEITTFRMDGDYLDGRHPSSVAFTRSLAEDLKRRDFTVNAMAWSPREGLTDLFGGRRDLERRTVRCVGEPQTRFTEDGLRILRALRFAAQLEFEIEPATGQAMRALRGRLTLISRERIREELLRILRAPAGVAVLTAYGEVLGAALPDYPADALAAGAAALAALPPQSEDALLLAALLSDCEADVAERCLESLRLPTVLTREVLQLLAALRKAWPVNDTPQQLAALGEKQLRRLIILQKSCDLLTAADAQRYQQAADDAMAAHLPLTLRELAVHGDDLLALGWQGAQIGRTLTALHKSVLRGEIPNERGVLLARLRDEKDQ